MSIDISSNENLLESINCMFYFIKIKVPMLKDLKFEVILTKKHNQRLTILSSMEKNYYDQAIDSDIKRSEEIRKLTIGQGKG